MAICFSAGGRGIANESNLCFEMFGMDPAVPLAKPLITGRYCVWLISWCRYSALMQSLGNSRKIRSGNIKFLGVSLTIAVIPTYSRVFFLEKSRSPAWTSSSGTNASAEGNSLFSSGSYSPYVTALNFSTAGSSPERG